MNIEFMIEVAGWLGVIFYVCAYLLLTIGTLQSNGYIFHSLNILGAIGLIIDAAYFGDRPNLAVNVIWLIIGIFAVIRRLTSPLR